MLSSGNEADSEGEYCGKEYREMIEMMKEFNPYMFEPEKNVSSTSSTEGDSEKEDNNIVEDKGRVGKLDWCTCKLCGVETREIDCLCCQSGGFKQNF